MFTFEELGISQQYVRAIVELGFEAAMPVQEKVIPLVLNENQDMIVLAQTGTGKTAAYGLPLIQMIAPEVNNPQVLVLCPTRELCMQIADDLNDFAKFNNDLTTLPVFGGSSIDVQIKALRKGIQIVVATPGRLLDLIRRKAIKLNQIRTVVLDEADEMLNMGFSEDLRDILETVPPQRRALLFSATMPSEVASIARKYMKDPIEVTIGTKNAGAENIKHVYYTVHAKDKYPALKRIVDFYPSVYGIVFCRTRKETQEIADKLIQDGYNAESLHGDLSQIQRDTVMNKFRIGHIRLLVATDVAARGLDVENLTHIINYNLPEDLDSYTHRSGRTGRAGRFGTSIILLNLKEKYLIKKIEKKINKTFTSSTVPTGRQICEKQLFSMVDKMEKVDIDNEEIDTYLPQIYRKLEWLDKEEIIKRFVALEFNRFIEYYKNAQDLNVPEDNFKGNRGEKFGKKDWKDRSHGNDDGKPDWKERNQGGEAGFTKLIINKGRQDGMFAAELMELINRNTHGKKIRLGKIELTKKAAIFEVPGSEVGQLMKSLKNARFGDAAVKVDFLNEKKSPNKKFFRG
ncbi:MAG: DEAD/DEAH box helicase [Bacteroidetes bacterium]|nr:DEAD/DEAH box helicase [Bacteroidota bacterium]